MCDKVLLPLRQKCCTENACKVDGLWSQKEERKNIGFTSVCNRTWGFSAISIFECHVHNCIEVCGVLGQHNVMYFSRSFLYLHFLKERLGCIKLLSLLLTITVVYSSHSVCKLNGYLEKYSKFGNKSCEQVITT
jgi:hypothetical protein